MRWVGGRLTFIVATSGLVIGFNNYYRYPIFMYTGGGFMFLFPYFLSMMIFGFPLLLLELTVGQMYQRSGVGVMRAIHPRLIGVGISKVYAALILASYYFYLCGLAAFYLAESFRDPLKWSTEDFQFKCVPIPAVQYYVMDVQKIMNSSCQYLQPGDISDVNWWLFFATAVIWCLVYGMVFKGAKSISYTVWVTVIVPTVLLFILLIGGSTIDGANEGLKLYARNEKNYDHTGEFESNAYWSDAFDFIYATLYSSTGLLIVYGSYNKRDKPVILDSFVIWLFNCLFSFISGLALFMLVGYLREKNNPAAATNLLSSSLSFAFTVIPTGALGLEGENFW